MGLGSAEITSNNFPQLNSLDSKEIKSLRINWITDRERKGIKARKGSKQCLMLSFFKPTITTDLPRSHNSINERFSSLLKPAQLRKMQCENATNNINLIKEMFSSVISAPWSLLTIFRRRLSVPQRLRAADCQAVLISSASFDISSVFSCGHFWQSIEIISLWSMATIKSIEHFETFWSECLEKEGREILRNLFM